MGMQEDYQAMVDGGYVNPNITRNRQRAEVNPAQGMRQTQLSNIPVNDSTGSTLAGMIKQDAINREVQKFNGIGNGEVINKMGDINSKLPNNLFSGTYTGNPPANDRIFQSSSMNDYIKKSWSIENPSGRLDATNPTTKAFSHNQVLPKYKDYYNKKAGITDAQSKTLAGQQRIAESIYGDTTKYLDSKGYDKSDRNRYLVHQQGRQGFSDLMNGKYNDQSLRQNIPSSVLKNAPKNQNILDTYLGYWDSRFN